MAAPALCEKHFPLSTQIECAWHGTHILWAASESLVMVPGVLFCFTFFYSCYILFILVSHPDFKIGSHVNVIRNFKKLQKQLKKHFVLITGFENKLLLRGHL